MVPSVPTLPLAKWGWDYRIKDIDSENCRLVQTLVGFWEPRLLCFAETISEMVVRRYVDSIQCIQQS